MSSDSIQKLKEHFERFPGIGPRQARRFVYWLLNQDDSFLENMSGHLLALKQNTKQCPECFRFFNAAECEFCKSANRDNNFLMVVEKDSDLESVEKSKVYAGRYFVLGDVIPLGADIPKTSRLKELFQRVAGQAAKQNIKEIILAMSATAEGDNTSRYIEKILEPLAKKHAIKISRFGRGLSTGTELEYIDAETLKNAMENRK